MTRFVIVTPVLNGAQYIKENLLSIRVQSDPDWVHYFVDGGSTDGTLDILAKAVSEDPRIHLVTGKDRGLYDAVFKGFEQAIADGQTTDETVCGWLGSDDLLMPWAFGTLRKQFDETGADWIAALPTIWDPTGRQVMVRPYNWYPRRLIRMGLFSNRGLGGIQQESTFFTYRLLADLPDEVVERIRTSQLAGDFMLWREFARRTRLVSIPATVAGFRQHRANLSTIAADSYLGEIRATGVRLPPIWLGRLSRMLYVPIALLATASIFRRNCVKFAADQSLGLSREHPAKPVQRPEPV